MNPERRTGRHTLSTFEIPKMDCPSEVNMIRMALEGQQEVHLGKVDLARRRIEVRHRASADHVLQLLTPLALGAHLLTQRPATARDGRSVDATASSGQRRVLRVVLAINLTMFFAESLVGWFAQSTGLLADSLDMLADAGVYALSLFAVGRGPSLQRRAAQLAGVLQALLGLGVLGEVGRRALSGSEPVSEAMMGMAAVALLANLACVKVLMPHRDGGVHMTATWIFTTADALANLGVIAAGGLVLLTDSPLPDLIVGSAIGLLVLRSAFRILGFAGRASAQPAPRPPTEA